MSEDRLLEVVGQLYEAATDSRRLKTIGSLIAREVDSASSLVFTARNPSAKLVHLVSASSNFEASAQADYRAYYHDRNEWFRRGARLPPPLIARGDELIDYDHFSRTEFCNDWCMRVGIYHLLAATFPLEDGLMGAIGIHRERSAAAFNDDEKRLLLAVTPHLMRAVQIAHRLGVIKRDGELTLDILHGLGVGLLLLDGECRPLFTNAVAERFLRAARWLTLSGGRIRTVSRSSAPRFERAVGLACGTSAGVGLRAGAIIRLRDLLAVNLAVLVAPFRAVGLDLGAMRPAAAVIFADPEALERPSAEAIAEAQGLTPAESRLVAALASGQSLAGYARSSGVSINTAKAQLRSVFLKTGYARQSDLVAAILADPVLRLEGAAH